MAANDEMMKWWNIEDEILWPSSIFFLFETPGGTERGSTLMAAEGGQKKSSMGKHDDEVIAAAKQAAEKAERERLEAERIIITWQHSSAAITCMDI